MSSKERTRRWREKIKKDPAKNKEYLAKDRAAAKRRKERGEIKSVKDLGPRAQRRQRKSWRNSQKIHREKVKNAKEAQTFLELNSPPHTPDALPAELGGIDGRGKRGRKRVRNERSKSYREIQKLRMALEKKSQLAEMYRKRLQRQERRTTDSEPLTPRSKTRRLLKYACNGSIRKTLLYHNTLVESLKKKYKDSRKELEKRKFKDAFCKKILKRYRFKSRFDREICRIDRGNVRKTDRPGRTRVRSKFDDVTRKQVEIFFEREDNARMTAGKKETITKEKIKKQKLFLRDSMKNLHLKFLSEFPNESMSYATFCRLRPFWVRIPTIRDREVCICQIHDNCNLLFSKLKGLGVIQHHTSADQLISTIVCDEKNRNCAFRTCNSCKEKDVPLQNIEPNRQTEWQVWKRDVQERYSKKVRENVEYGVTIKATEYGTVENLIEKFQDSMIKLTKHVYTLRKQFREIRFLRQNIGDREVAVHMDFSENWTCRYAREITSVHFGASTKSASLHDGIIHLKDEKLTFCSISDSTQHDAPAIWAHLHPLLRYIRNEYPEKTHLHCISDSPTSQYRGKRNMFLMSKIPYEMGFKKVMWHYFEAGHGKGPADGVGASIKRTADQLIANGTDIPDAQSLYHQLKSDTTIKMFYVPEQNISKFADLIPQDVPTYHGTMTIHQVYSEKIYELSLRPVTCFCSGSENFCQCYSPGRILYTPVDNTENNYQNGKASRDPPTCDLQSEIATFVSDEELVGKWCMVLYDNRLYPGIIKDVDKCDNTFQAMCMCCVGENRFFWGNSDVCWYKACDFVGLISAPIPVTEKSRSRHQMVERDDWERCSKRIEILM